MEFKQIPCDKEGYITNVFRISDNGIGMSDEFKTQLFDSFTRERNTTESKIIGTGLGMSIVKKLVDMLEGRIEFESEKGKGTTFEVVIDCKIAENPEKYIVDESKTELKINNIKGERILLAEDNELNAEIAVAILEEAGFVVERAEDGVECINMLNSAPSSYYSAILMDIQMPNLDGYKATERIRGIEDKEKANIPIIAMTANAFEEDKKNAREAGMNAHISKPIEIEKLLETLSQVLGRRA